MVSLLGSAGKGMSFEERDGDGGQDEETHGEDAFNGNSNELLITSTNGIGDLNNTLTFKRVDTLWTSFLMMTISVALFVLSAVIPFECDNHLSSQSDSSSPTRTAGGLCFINPVSLLLYLHALMWGIFLIFDQYIQYQHVKVRRRGYMDFYNETKVSSQLPFWVVSAWSTLLLAVSTVLHDHCISGKDCAKSIHLTQTEYITICIGLETSALLVVVSYYIYQVWRFNANKVPPDVFQDEMMSSALDFNPDSMGRVDEEIFHRQADLIRYYKDRNTVLQRTVLHLNQLLGRSINSNV